MFKILQKTIRTGIVTTPYPGDARRRFSIFPGKPVFDLERWRDARGRGGGLSHAERSRFRTKQTSEP